jgi:signal transduction histidine kinase
VLPSTKIFQTSAFRLAAIYFAVFALSVAGILSYIVYNTANLLERQIDETIRAEVLGLSDQYRLRGLQGVVDVIQRRSSGNSATFYLLRNPNRVRLVGNLQEMPPQADGEPGWIDFPMQVRVGEGQTIHTARAYHLKLSGDFHLLVGRDIQELRQFNELIWRTVYIAVPVALLLGLGGGFVTSRNFLTRVNDISTAARTIMDGDLTLRMPVKGTSDELDRLSVSLNDMLEQIERLMTGMKEVTSNVAHDLKTPLTRLKARVEAALRSGDPTEYRAALTQSIDESDRLLQTFNALLSIARAEAGQSREGLQLIDLNDVLRDVGDLYEPLVEEAGGTLTLDVDGSLPVKADRQLMAQAVSNLIDNAIKYGTGERANSVSLSSATHRGMAEVIVSDSGPGIAEADRERVKGRFIRLDESRSKPGNGLGLSLVASVMKLHGGQFTLEDNAPGLRAKLVLPLMREA